MTQGEQIAGRWLFDFRCRCGAGCSVLLFKDGDQQRDGIVHPLPFCKAFEKIDHPADFLKYVRTGRWPS